jgi:glucan phosphoethanolaminetransferase (alkaline phosphatase superfamily)
MDEIVHGVLAGLCGPAFARWLVRYRFRVIFVATWGVFYAVAFVTVILSGHSIAAAFRTFVDRTLTTWGILAPIAVSLLVVFCAFIGSIGPKR